MSISRIILSLTLLAACALPVFAEARWQPKNGDVVKFNVLREGKPFGTHTVSFKTDPDGRLVATTKVSLKAGLGPVTLFRYQLDATETWLNGKLLNVKGNVNDDGKKRSVTATREGDAIAVAGSDYKGPAPGDIVPASHWNFEQTEVARLLSTEDGEIFDVKVSPLGRQSIQAGGSTIEANHYRLDSALDVDLWYDDEGRWVKLAFEARGQKIEYVLDRLY
jgi:hypothetical protein